MANRVRKKNDGTIRTKRTAELEEKILEVLRDGYSESAAARKVGIGRTTLNEWKRKFPEFAKKVADACVEGVDVLEDFARDWALVGIPKALVFQGKLTGHKIDEHSESLLGKLLDRRRPVAQKVEVVSIAEKLEKARKRALEKD